MRSAVSEVKRRKKLYKARTVQQYGENRRKNRWIGGPEFSDIYVVTFVVVAIGPDVFGDEEARVLS